jgi:hypothetical protein
LLKDQKAGYKLSALAHFLVTFLLVSFSIISLVQGIKLQFAGDTYFAITLYFATPLMVYISFLSFQKAHYKLRILAMART